MKISDITPEYLIQNGINPEGLLFGAYHLPYNPQLKVFCREMRCCGEKAEALLWEQLKSKQTGYSFTRQKPILNYIADFYCKKLSLVVEVDGFSHFSRESYERDCERDRQMRAIGLQVIRVEDEDVRKDAEYVAKKVKEKFPVGEVLIHVLDPVIGTHSGPGTLALFFMGDKR